MDPWRERDEGSEDEEFEVVRAVGKTQRSERSEDSDEVIVVNRGRLRPLADDGGYERERRRNRSIGWTFALLLVVIWAVVLVDLPLGEVTGRIGGSSAGGGTVQPIGSQADHNPKIITNQNVQNVQPVQIPQRAQSVQKAQSIQQVEYQQNTELYTHKEGQTALPRILWVLTDRDINSSKLEPTFYGFHMHSYAQRSNFQTRFVDHETAYQWLSPEIKNLVTQAMHRRKYDISVAELLRIALLIDHGGVVIRPGSAVLIEKFEWVQNIFREYEGEKYPGILECKMKEIPQVFMFSERNAYLDFFMAGRRNSSLLGEVFREMVGAVEFGKGKYPLLSAIEVHDKTTNSFSLRNFFQTFVNSRMMAGEKLKQCLSWKIQSIDINLSAGRAQLCSQNIDFIMKSDRKQARRRCGLQYLFRTTAYEVRLTKLFTMAIANGVKGIGQSHENSIIREDFFAVEGIRQLLEPIGKTRQVELCIVSLKVVKKGEGRKIVGESLQRLKTQSFGRWRAVYFAEDGSESLEQDSKMVVVSASAYEGLNLQTAITQHCPLRSIVFLLDHDEQLSSPQNLKQLSISFSDRSVYSAFVPLQQNSNRLFPKNPTRIKRIQTHPNREELTTITNHLRVFNSDYYRIISHNDLHNTAGEYYDRTIPLIAMVEMSLNMQSCNRQIDVFQVKRMRQKLDFPEKRVTLSFSIVIQTYIVLDLSKPEYNYKFNYLHFCYMVNLKNTVDPWGWLGEEMLVFNKGAKYLSPIMRREMPKVIPRKIHQIWINGQPSPAKQFMMDEVRRLHPEFEYFLWSKDNITRQNFPYTYEIIQTLLEFDKTSKYSRLAMVSDFMRLEIVYQHGGFYLDTNYLWFGRGSLEDWRSYQLVMSGELYPRMFVYASNSFFGAVEKNVRFLRVLRAETVNRVKIHQTRVSVISGPGFLKHILKGEVEESDGNVLKPSMEELYPFYPFDGMSSNNFCRVNLPVVNGVPTAANSSELMFVHEKWGFLKNCSEFYPMAYGMDFYELGGSWLKPKW